MRIAVVPAGTLNGICRYDPCCAAVTEPVKSWGGSKPTSGLPGTVHGAGEARSGAGHRGDDSRPQSDPPDPAHGVNLARQL